ncbi:MAG: hypothetical protein JWO09_365 [Bacteroidetes bacterium]|nr:hypothetical protein [Bacteroidota bacterium]
MYRKLSYILLVMIGALVCTGHYSFAQCKAKQIMKSSKANITRPFKFDSYTVNEFIFGDKQTTQEVQFTAFRGMKYKIVFISSGFEEPVQVNIWDKSNKIKKNRNKVYDNAQGIDNNFWSFEPTKAGNYFIEYTVPVSSTPGVTKQGCIIMLISYVETEPGAAD